MTRRVEKAARRAVCMIAYTNYAIDARVRREAETLASHGFRVSCLTNRNHGTGTRYVLNGVEVRELGVPKYRGKSTAAYLASYLRFLAAATVACLGRLLRGELDVVHVHNLPDFLVFAALLPRLAGKKVVLDIHDSVPETFATKFSGSARLHKLLCLEERMSAAVAHKVICVNHPQRDVLVGRGIPFSKTFVSMNVPDPKIFGSPSRPPHSPNGHFNLVYHGTMAERLGVDLVIRAVSQLRERIPCLRLHLWGGGDDLAAFERLVSELGVGDRVSFKPKGFPLEELPGHLSAMDLGVVGNRSNTATDLMLPVKLLEYVSLRIPAVVPRLRTIDHYFSDDMVSYFDAEDVSSLADAIHRMYCQPTVRRRQADSAETFLDRYGWDRQGSELVAMYNALVEN
jgi:glycosyltransferase involved in cell wall biosynthesis